MSGYLEGLEKRLGKRIRKDLQSSLGNAESEASPIFENKNILVVSPSFPSPDKSSSARRLSKILRMFSDMGLSVCYAYFLYEDRENLESHLEKYPDKIHFIHIPADLVAFQRFVMFRKIDSIWFTNFWREVDIQFFMRLALDFKLMIGAEIIVDSMDFHCKKYFRKYIEQGNGEDLYRARRFFALARKFYSLADLVTVVSEEEKRDIEKNIPYTKKVEVLANVYELSIPKNPFDGRGNICFVANFGVNQNIDSANEFIKNIFPYLLKKKPTLEFHIIGYRSEDFKKAWESENVKVIGYVPELRNFLERYRVFVNPLAYGTGLKGKIGSALESGLPVVSTSVGMEGYPFEDGKDCFIEDDHERFADKCLQVMEDPDIWYRHSAHSIIASSFRYTPKAICNVLSSCLKESFAKGDIELRAWENLRGNTVAIIGRPLQELCEDAFSFEIFLAMKIFLRNGFQIYYLSEEESFQTDLIIYLKNSGVIFVRMPMEEEKAREWIIEKNPSYLWVCDPMGGLITRVLANLYRDISSMEIRLLWDLRFFPHKGRHRYPMSQSFCDLYAYAQSYAEYVFLFSIPSAMLVESLHEKSRVEGEEKAKAYILPLFYESLREKSLGKKDVFDGEAFFKAPGVVRLKRFSELLEEALSCFNEEKIREDRSEENAFCSLLLQGEEALEVWDFDEAKEAFEKILQNSDFFENFSRYIQDMDLIKAENFFLGILTFRVKAYCGISVAEYVEGDKRTALEILDKAAQIAPFDPIVQKNRAKICEDLGIAGLQEAVKAYQFVLEEFPQDGEALLGISKLFDRIGALETAMHFFHRLDSSALAYPNIWKRRVSILKEIENKWGKELGMADLNLEKESRESESSFVGTLRQKLEEKKWLDKFSFYRGIFSSVQDLKGLKKAKLSIVIVAKSLKPNVFSCFRAIHSQREENAEIIFVDLGSREGEFSALLPFIDRYISLKGKVLRSCARNIGALFSCAPILLFIDEDSIPDGSCLKEHLQAFERFGPLAVRGKILPLLSRDFSEEDRKKAIPMAYSSPHPIDIEENVSCQSEAFYRAGGWDDRVAIGGGLELSLRLLRIHPNMCKQMYCSEAIVWKNYSFSEEEKDSIKRKKKQWDARRSLKYLSVEYVRKWEKFSSCSKEPYKGAQDYWRLGIDSKKEGDLSKAFFYLKMAVELSPLYREIVSDYVGMCREMKCYREAVRVCFFYLKYFYEDQDILDIFFSMQSLCVSQKEWEQNTYSLKRYDCSSSFEEEI